MVLWLSNQGGFSLVSLHFWMIYIMLNNRDGEDLDSQGDASSQPDTISLASRTSQNTLDSDKVSGKICLP